MWRGIIKNKPTKKARMTFENIRHAQKIYKRKGTTKQNSTLSCMQEIHFLKSDSKTLNNHNHKGMSKGILEKDWPKKQNNGNINNGWGRIQVKKTLNNKSLYNIK